MEPINRFALVVRPKRRYLEWANSLRKAGEGRLTVEELAGFQEVYLLDASEPDLQREAIIDRYADEIWDQQLSAWASEEADWPPNRTPHTLRDWFELLFVDMVFDADPEIDWSETEPFESEAEAAQAESRICQWCQTVTDDDQPIVTLSFKLPSEPPVTPGTDVLVPLVIAGTVRIAIRAQPDSEAARAGHDLILTFCSDHCASEMRAALERERGARLS